MQQFPGYVGIREVPTTGGSHRVSYYVVRCAAFLLSKGQKVINKVSRRSRNETQ